MVDYNPFIEQLRHRIDSRERKFRDAIEAIKSSQAAAGSLKSGHTISLCLARMNSDFVELTDEILAYLGKAISRMNWPLDEPLDIAASRLMQSAIGFKSMVQPEWLLNLAGGKRVQNVIDQAFEELDTGLRLRLADFRLGLHDAAPPPSVPASNRYVSVSDNQRTEIEVDLADLRDHVQGDNEATEDERLIALSEIAAFEITIVQPRVSAELIQRFVDKVLVWMTKAFAGAALALVAKKIIEALMPFLA